jgi:acyl-CoA synthetase (AMP-forming)/AMP-acid ligase II/3-oxoacyl-(acyl-carrier-protein) synthase/acyl carrier protein
MHESTNYEAAPRSLVDVVRGWARIQSEKRAYRFLADGSRESARLTYGELDERARAIAARMQALGLEGERALLLYPPGLEFVAAFLGCLYGGVVAIPASLGRANQPMSRLRAIAADSRPRAVLTVAERLPDTAQWPARIPELEGFLGLATDDLPSELAGSWRDPSTGPNDLAFLQYTSGSTATPKGVMVTHANLIHNSSLIQRAFGTVRDGEGVSWLPVHHDMGLIGGVLQTIYCGASSTLMAPAAFLQRPLRWLDAISRTGALVSGGPNFAYELCARKATPERIAGLDLSGWRVAFNGSEPVRADSLERFAAAFASCGFRREALLPCYGMAETTLLVSAGQWQAPPVIVAVDPAALEQGHAEPAQEVSAARDIVGCGTIAEGLDIAIVDPDTGARLLHDRIGEIWVSGPSVAAGYWGRLEETRATFEAHLPESVGVTYLRTGDLGFVRAGELFVTGRLKDMIIIRGRNVYPQDIEWTAARSHPRLRPDGGAAFGVEIAGQERLVIVHEVEPRQTDALLDAVIRAVRDAVAAEHELDVYAVSLIPAPTLPRTSSGKVRRHACREQWLSGSLDELARSVIDPVESRPEATRHIYGAAPHGARDIREWLVTRLAAALGIAAAEIDPERHLAGTGLSSVQVISLTGELEEWLDRPLAPTLVYEYPTLDELSRYLAGELDAPQHSEPARPLARATEPIAIIGIGCRFPGGADGPEAFWRLLHDGVDAVGTAPAGRWADNPDTRAGGFLQDVEFFDAERFGLAPREASLMDPQQRLLLEVASQAFEDAGHPPQALAGSAVAVFVGISSNDYGIRLQSVADVEGGHLLTGNARSIAANRISYAFDLRGPSMAIDTACSSSLVAVHMACEALQDGEATLALAGGVNLVLAPEISDALGRGGFLSPEGRCKAFDASADGYVRGEGCGLVVLKPLATALVDGDAIYAVIRGGAVNQDGRTSGLTVPNRRAQEAVLRDAYRKAGVDPAQVNYVEAHGTGTLLGDPIEAKALSAVLRPGRRPDHPCLIGSVKTNLGHLEAAAGIAGLIKVTLALHHRELPQGLHFDRPNPHVPFESLGLRVLREASPWPACEGPPLAGVSSFGFGGSNAHLVLEGVAPATHETVERPSRTPCRDWNRRRFWLDQDEEASARRQAAALSTEDGDWRALPPDGQLEWLVRLIREKVALGLEQDAAEIATDRPLDILGVDSLTAMEVKWAVEDSLGRTLPTESLTDSPTIVQLAERAIKHLETAVGRSRVASR